MGRLFVIELEEPVYRCKMCQIEFAVADNRILKRLPLIEYPVRYGKLYYFRHCFNVVVGTEELHMPMLMNEVFCISCSSLVGLYYEGEATLMYNEGNFYINRFKLNGPPDGSDDDENPGN